MFANFLYALDPTGDHIAEMYMAIQSACATFIMNKPSTPGLPDDWIAAIEDAFIDLIMLKGGDIDAEAKKALQEDMAQILKMKRDELLAMNDNNLRETVKSSIHELNVFPKALKGASLLYTGIRTWDKAKILEKAKQGQTPGGRLAQVFTVRKLSMVLVKS